LTSATSPAAPGDLFVAGGQFNREDQFIFRFTPSGVRSTFATGLYEPVALAFDREGNLFVADSGSGIPPMQSTIVKFALDGTRSTFATLNSSELLALAFDGGGNLFASDGLDILKFAP